MIGHASSARSLNAAQPGEMIQISFFFLVSFHPFSPPRIQSSHIQSVSTRARSHSFPQDAQ